MSDVEIGIRATPQGTLVDRALRFLGEQSADSLTLARDVLGIGRATRAVADRVAVALLGADPRVRRMSDGKWALAGAREGAVELANCTFAVVDVETTGNRPAGCVDAVLFHLYVVPFPLQGDKGRLGVRNRLFLQVHHDQVGALLLAGRSHIAIGIDANVLGCRVNNQISPAGDSLMIDILDGRFDRPELRAGLVL